MSKATDSSAAPVRVLIVDDDEGHAEALADGLEIDGYQCRLAGSGREGIERMSEATFDAILTDLVMHDVDGLQVLKEATRLQPDAVVLMITGHGSVENAVNAMRLGAADYLTKPVRIAELRTRLARAVEAVRLRRANRELRRQLDERYGFEGLIGNSPAMQKVFTILRQVSPTHATVLILGASGTGKELVAHALHTNSRRKDKPFVAINCAALTQGLIESELFGHVKGAFTGAVTTKDGLLVSADGGTMFLDEVGDMPLETQAKLLRVLETREVQPVGGNTTRKVDIRLVAATNHDLEQLVKEGKFREDLLFRLQVVTIKLPPLRERSGDVPVLIDHFIQHFAKEHDREVRGITPEARTLLVRYSWPGNVRELQNVINNMVVLAQGDVLTEDDVPEQVKRAAGGPSDHGAHLELAGRSMAEIERAVIQANLELVNGNRQKAAKILGIGERTLYRKIKEYGL